MRTLRRADALEPGDVIALPGGKFGYVRDVSMTPECQIKIVYHTGEYLGMRNADPAFEGTILTPEEPEAKELIRRLRNFHHLDRPLHDYA
jgi:hypothetical protein